MKNRSVLIVVAGFSFLLLLSVCGCKKTQDPEPVNDPFNTGSGTRNLIVVISDLHLGADLSYAECNANVAPLGDFLAKIRSSKNVKELVIAGDLIDEWFVPATTDTYQGKDQADFVGRVAAANKIVFDQINAINTDGIIKVTYIPGNHDLAISGDNIDRVLPGIRQARDNGIPLGLGTYYPDNCPQIAMEHGHRYSLYCAPDPAANQSVAPGTILPPGYFYTRIAALHVVQNCTVPADTVPVVTPNPSGGASQARMYDYWQFWQSALTLFPIQNHFNENIIVTGVNGFKGTYSVNDVLPHQTTPGGTISVKLYDGEPDNWPQRCIQNHVPVPISMEYALTSSSSTATDTMAYIQYFMNPSSDARVVLFGHTHVPLIRTWTNHAGQKSVGVNSGTWIDNNPNHTTRNFVIITPQNSDPASQTMVTLYNYLGGTCNQMGQESLRF